MDFSLGEKRQAFLVLSQSIPCGIDAVLGKHGATGLVRRDAAVDEREHGQPGHTFCTPHQQVEAVFDGMAVVFDMLSLENGSS